MHQEGGLAAVGYFEYARRHSRDPPTRPPGLFVLMSCRLVGVGGMVVAGVALLVMLRMWTFTVPYAE